MDGSQFVAGRSLVGKDRALTRTQQAAFLQRDLSEQALRKPAAPVFDSADLTASRQAGFEAGHAAGLAEAAASLAAAQTAALGAIATALAAGQAEAAQVADEAGAALAAALVAAMDAVMPELIRRSALGEAGAMLAHILPGLSREPEVHVEVPPQIAAGVAAALRKLAPGRGEAITVTAAEALADGSVEVHWAAGRAQRHPVAIWLAVMDVLEPALTRTPSPAQARTPSPALARTPFKDFNHGQ
jgi:hypothetical protein